MVEADVFIDIDAFVSTFANITGMLLLCQASPPPGSVLM
jgi:hypothetical protein